MIIINKNSGNKSKIIIVLLCVLLVFSAVIGGYVFSNRLARSIVEGEQDNHSLEDKIETEVSSKDNQADEIDLREDEAVAGDTEDSTGSSAIVPVPIDMHPANVSFLINEDYEVVTIYLELLDCVKMEYFSMKFSGDISYTMTSELYRELTASNVTLPQTVKFSELYHYYDDDRSFEAGKKILSEMLGINVGYYTGVSVNKYYNTYVNDSAQEIEYELEAMLKEAVTNWDYSQRYKYLPVYSSLRATDVWYEEAPVGKKNESTVPDVSGIVALIRQSGVDLWENEE